MFLRLINLIITAKAMKNQMGQVRKMHPETSSGKNCRFSGEWHYGGNSCLKSGVSLITDSAEKNILVVEENVKNVKVFCFKMM